MRPVCGPRAETLATTLVGRMRSLLGVLTAKRITLAAIMPEDPAAVALIDAARGAMLQSLRRDMLRSPVLGSGRALVDYLHFALAAEAREQFRVLFVDAAIRLMHEEILAHGSLTSTPVNPREIVKRALELGAVGLILVHNHPSGDPRPSSEDLHATALIVAAARPLDIVVHDHIVVARAGWVSFRAEGHL